MTKKRTPKKAAEPQPGTRTLTNRQVLDLVPVLVELGRERLKPRAALAIQRLKRQIREHAADVEAVKQQIVEQHALKDDEGNVVMEGATIRFTDQAAATTAWNEVLAETVEVGHTVALSWLEDVLISPDALDALEPLLVEDLP